MTTPLRVAGLARGLWRSRTLRTCPGLVPFSYAIRAGGATRRDAGVSGPVSFQPLNQRTARRPLVFYNPDGWNG